MPCGCTAGGTCPKAEAPDLKMRDANVGKSVGSRIECSACGATRGMAEAQGAVGRREAAADGAGAAILT
jgi:hypothetical protein